MEAAQMWKPGIIKTKTFAQCVLQSNFSGASVQNIESHFSEHLLCLICDYIGRDYKLCYLVNCFLYKLHFQ